MAKTPCYQSRDPGFHSPGQGARSHMPQLRVHVSQPKIQNATTKMGHSQVNKKKIVQRKRRRCGLKAWSLRVSPSTFTLPASSPLVMLLINSKL